MKNRCRLIIIIIVAFSGMYAQDALAQSWYTTTAGGGDIATLTNWWSTPGGTGTHPSNFTTPGAFWYVQGPMTSASGWTVGDAANPYYGGAVIIDSGASISNTCSGCGFYIYDTLDMKGNATITSSVSWYPYLYGYTNMSGTATITNTGSYYYLYNYGVLNMSGSSVITDAADYYYIYNYYSGSTHPVINMTGSSNITIGVSEDYYIYNYGNMSIGGNAIINGYQPIIYDYGSSAATGMVNVSGNAEIGGGAYAILYGYGTYTNVAGYYFSGNASLNATSETEVYLSDAATFSFNSTGSFCTSGTNYFYNEASGSSVTNPCLLMAVSGSGPVNMYWYNYYSTKMIGNVAMGNYSFYNQSDGGYLDAGIYTITGTGEFYQEGTLVTANPLGINGSIETTSHLFETSANYFFDGTTPQVTGTYLPSGLVAPSILEINNSTGVSLSQSTSTTGVLQFLSGILNTTPSYTMTASGAPGGITGAGATSYVKGTLIEPITGYTSLTYPVGDTDYVPVTLTLSSAGTAGSIGLKPTYGMHPAVASSGIYTTNIANHYWTINNSSAAGPATIIPTVTYNSSDIIGGSNSAFVTQRYSGTTWLGSPLVTTNTSSPYTSAPTGGITLASLAGQYIFGNSCAIDPITGPTGVCLGSSITLADASSGGTWSSGTTSVATISGGGVVTGITTGVTTIVYSVSGCSIATDITVSAIPTVTVTSGLSICSGSSATLTATGGATYSWSPGTGLSVTTGATVIASPTVTTTYTVTGTNGSGCSHTAVTTVTVNPAPTISAGSGVSISSGGSATLTATGGSTYTWAPPATLSVSTGASVIATPTVTTTYTVTGTNSSGCSNTAVVTVTVIACPVLTPATGATVCNPYTITFTDNGTWGALINDIKVNVGSGFCDLGAPGAATCYTLTVNTPPALSTITFNPAASTCLDVAGLYTINVYVPSGYSCGTASVLQPVGACTVSCGIPTATTTGSVTLTSAVISWSAVSSASEYELAYKTSAASAWTDVYTASTSESLTGLDSATYYDYKIRTICGPGDSSAYTAVDSFPTLSSCGTPTDVITGGITTTSAIISWAAVSRASEYLIGYQLYGASTWTYLLSTTTSRTITGLTPGTAYNYKVSTICGATDTSATSPVYTFATLISCGTPTAVTASGIASTSATISWAAVSGAVSYVLAYKKSTASTWTDVSVTTTSRTLTGLTPATIYDYQVRSVCGAGDSSSYSSSASFTTLSAAPPCSTPTGLASVLTSSVAVLSWSAVSGAYGYQVEYQLVTRGTPTYAYTTTNSIALTGLTLSSTYEFKVRSVCAAGDTSAASGYTTFRLGDEEVGRLGTGIWNLEIFPNPTQDKFTISYHLDESSPVTIVITNTLGQVVATPANNETQEEGDHSTTFAPLSSGLYIVKIMIGNGVFTEKVVRY